MNKGILITVRTGSERLPQKALKDVCGLPAIARVIQRAKGSQLARKIVLCTTELPEDDRLCEIAQGEGIDFFRGSLEDKLVRWLGATEKFDIDFFVTADGDDLLVDPELMDLAFRQYEQTQQDFIEGIDVPCGGFTYGIKTEALRKVCEIKDTDDTEMMWVYFKDTGLFQTAELENVPEIFKRPEIRMTLDYEDDLKFFRTVYGHFKGESVSLREVIPYLDEHPEVVAINQYLQQKYLDNQKRKVKLVLKKDQA